ncbi:postulated decoy of host sigma factor protein [Rhizobium phage RHph_N3_19]|nr:postulated decoy of host sigma factor protein [Rhizobium phage RHph_N3_19]
MKTYKTSKRGIFNCCTCGVEVERQIKGTNRSKVKCHPCQQVRKNNWQKTKPRYQPTEEQKIKYRENRDRKREEDPQDYILRKLQSSSKRRNSEFDLEKEDIIIPEVCPVFGTPFEIGTRYAPSVDRIDNSKGYVKGNVQIMSWMANSMKNSASVEQLIEFAEWVLRTYKDET